MSSQYDDISINVLRSMKEGGFDFARIHPIEFYAVSPMRSVPAEQPGNSAASRSMHRSVNVQMAAGIWS